MKDIFRQLPIPFRTSWERNKVCFYCNRLGNLGRVLYDSKLECGVFVCQDCKIITSTFCDDVPMETEFKNKHKCDGVCDKPSNTGVMTYCPNCETVEFVCPVCYEGFFDRIESPLSSYEIDYKDFAKNIEWEETVTSCRHVVDGSRPIHLTDPTYHNTMVAVCKECYYYIEHPEQGNDDFDKMFCRIESKKLKL